MLRNLELLETLPFMHIIVFTHSSHLEGAQRSLIDLVRGLIQDYQFAFTIVLPGDGPSIKLFKEAGAATLIASLNWWCTATNMPEQNETARLNAESFGWIINNLPLLEQNNPDVVLTNTLVIPWGAVAAALLKRPHVWMVNEFGVLDHGLNFFYPFSQVLNVVTNLSNKIVTRSKAIHRELFPDLRKEKIKTIYRSINIPENELQYVEDRYFKLPEACHLVIAGSIMESKGQEDAVRSVVELVKNRNRQVELVMVGNAQPEYLNSLKRIITNEKIDNHISILPFQENALPIINQADIVLICSRMEAFGRVVMEGMIMKKPVIATNTGGTPEMIEDGKTGLLYQPGNYLQLADMIEHLIANPYLQCQFAKEGQRFVSQTFTKEKFIGEYAQLISGTKKCFIPINAHVDGFINDLFHQTIRSNIRYVNYLKKINDDLSQEVQALNKKATQLEQDVLFYENSKSWKITKPFRNFFSIFKIQKHD